MNKKERYNDLFSEDEYLKILIKIGKEKKYTTEENRISQDILALISKQPHIYTYLKNHPDYHQFNFTRTNIKSKEPVTHYKQRQSPSLNSMKATIDKSSTIDNNNKTRGDLKSQTRRGTAAQSRKLYDSFEVKSTRSSSHYGKLSRLDSANNSKRFLNRRNLYRVPSNKNRMNHSLNTSFSQHNRTFDHMNSDTTRREKDIKSYKYPKSESILKVDRTIKKNMNVSLSPLPRIDKARDQLNRTEESIPRMKQINFNDNVEPKNLERSTQNINDDLRNKINNISQNLFNVQNMPKYSDNISNRSNSINNLNQKYSSINDPNFIKLPSITNAPQNPSNYVPNNINPGISQPQTQLSTNFPKIANTQQQKNQPNINNPNNILQNQIQIPNQINTISTNQNPNFLPQQQTNQPKVTVATSNPNNVFPNQKPIPTQTNNLPSNQNPNIVPSISNPNGNQFPPNQLQSANDLNTKRPNINPSPNKQVGPPNNLKNYAPAEPNPNVNNRINPRITIKEEPLFQGTNDNTVSESPIMRKPNLVSSKLNQPATQGSVSSKAGKVVK